MPRPEWRDPAKENHWRRLLGLWRSSGLNGRDFCAKYQLSLPSFYACRQEIARRDREKHTTDTPARRCQSLPPRSAAPTRPAFVQLTPTATLLAMPTLEVVLAGGRLLRVGAGFDAGLLRQVLAVLEEPPC